MSAVGFVLRDLLVGYGYFAVLIVVAAENLGLPLPGETILVTAAIYAGTTHVLRLPLIILAASAGALAGSSAAFAIGRRYGDALVGRYGRYIRLDEAKMRLGRYLFMRYGGAIVFLGRFVAFLRALAGLLAGVNRMTTGRFLVYNGLGAALWASLFGVSGYLFGERLEHASRWINVASGVLVISAVAAAFMFVRRNQTQLQMRADRALLHAAEH